MKNNVEDIIKDDPYIKRFLQSPIYVSVISKTIEMAEESFKIARILSIFLFGTGVALLIVAIVLGIYLDKEAYSLIFGGFGMVSIISLLVYRPIERIQSGVNDLIRSQIICLSFMGPNDPINRSLATMSELPFDDPNRDFKQEMEWVKYLQEANSRLIADLDKRGISSIENKSAEK